MLLKVKLYWKELLLLFIGSLTPFLFLIQSPWVITTRKIPISPLPLVFDSFNHYTHWYYSHTIKIYTSHREYLIPIDKKFISQHKRGFLIQNIYFDILLSDFLVNDEFKSLQSLQPTLCTASFDLPKDKILKMSLEVRDFNNQIFFFREWLCQ